MDGTWDDFSGPVELVFKANSDVSKERQFPPARPQRARAGQSVALAFRPHVVLDRLINTSFSSYKTWIKPNCLAYQSAGLIVVQHDLNFEVSSFAVTGVHKLTRFLISVLNVIRASAPLPIAIRRHAFGRKKNGKSIGLI